MACISDDRFSAPGKKRRQECKIFGFVRFLVLQKPFIGSNQELPMVSQDHIASIIGVVAKAMAGQKSESSEMINFL